VKTNVTLKLDRDLLTEARTIAAEEGSSLSALLSERLETLVRERPDSSNYLNIRHLRRVLGRVFRDKGFRGSRFNSSEVQRFVPVRRFPGNRHEPGPKGRQDVAPADEGGRG
jgi:hypothetical protein